MPNDIEDAKLFPRPDNAVSFAEYMNVCDGMTDTQIWLLAALAVGAAAKRAVRVDRLDIENLCRTFAIDLHTVAGTPPPPPRWSTR